MAGRTATPDWNRLILKVPREPVLVRVPTLKFLMVDGIGDPATSAEFRDAIGALYGLAYTMKFMLKKRGIATAVPMPLEGLFWADDMDAFLVKARRGEWRWTLMLAQPDVVGARLLTEAKAEIARRKKGIALPPVRLARFAEGLCAQVLHRGPYAAEKPTIERLHRFIADQGLARRGHHHEIYISRPGGNPAAMKTVIRQPVASAARPRRSTKRAAAPATRTPRARTRRS